MSLKLTKTTYIGICILEISNCCTSCLLSIKYEFYYDYIKLNMTTDQNYYSQALKMSMKILAAINKCLILVIFQLNQNNMMVQIN